MNTSITLDETHYKAVAEKARALNQTPEEFVQALIDAHTRGFDQSPSTARWAKSTDDDLEALFQRTRVTTRHVDE